ncbi:MAG TPA: DUF4440 domain-containing protein [Candidatus Didemnitutus sp.]|nr:DUF4440 domain-containing protein [Candidatus Didemnitutus sp.]
MITRRAFALVVLCTAALAVPARASDAIDEIRQLISDQTAAWNRGDLEGFMAGYAHTDTLRFASGGTITYGWEPTLKRYQAHYPDRTAMGVLSLEVIDVTVLAPDAAVAFGRWKLVRVKDAPHGLFTLVLRHEAAEWRIIADHTSLATE